MSAPESQQFNKEMLRKDILSLLFFTCVLHHQKNVKNIKDRGWTAGCVLNITVLSPQQGEELLRKKLQIKPGLIEEKQEKLWQNWTNQKKVVKLV